MGVHAKAETADTYAGAPDDFSLVSQLISAADAAFINILNVSGPVNFSSNLVGLGLSNMGDVTTGNLSVNRTLYADYVRSTQFRASSVFYDVPGNGGTMAGGFSSGGGTLMIFASGSGWRATGGKSGCSCSSTAATSESRAASQMNRAVIKRSAPGTSLSQAYRQGTTR